MSAIYFDYPAELVILPTEITIPHAGRFGRIEIPATGDVYLWCKQHGDAINPLPCAFQEVSPVAE